MIYRIANVELYSSQYLLFRDGCPVPVEPLVFDLIFYLSLNSGRLVSREELFEQLWKGRIVTDSALSHVVSEARKALGDDGRRQSIIRTVHGHGYECMAQVDTADCLEHSSTGSESAEESLLKVAILPIRDLSEDGSLQTWCSALEEELLNLLSRTPQLRIIRQGEMQRRISDSPEDTTHTARGGHLGHQIDGSIRRAGQRLRISIHLNQARDGSCLWTEIFENRINEDIDTFEHIAHLVVEHLKRSLLTPAGTVRPLRDNKTV